MQILYKVSRGCYLGSAFNCNERMMKQKSKFRGQESMRDTLEYAKQNKMSQQLIWVEKRRYYLGRKIQQPQRKCGDGTESAEVC